jgi:hypothetical protein
MSLKGANTIGWASKLTVKSQKSNHEQEGR